MGRGVQARKVWGQAVSLNLLVPSLARFMATPLALCKGTTATLCPSSCRCLTSPPTMHTLAPPLPPVQVPALTDGWNDVKEKFSAATEDFKVCTLRTLAGLRMYLP